MKLTFKAHRTSLKEGNAAPDFSGKDQNNNLISLKDFAGKKLVLYFYPKDDTPGCTVESCSLRDNYNTFLKKGYAVIGVSADTERSHAKFARKYKLPFPLLSDTDKKIIQDYDVWGKKMLFGRTYDGIIRTTFIISPNGIIERVINDVDTREHAAQILTGSTTNHELPTKN